MNHALLMPANELSFFPPFVSLDEQTSYETSI
jgi:hypothetical protein